MERRKEEGLARNSLKLWHSSKEALFRPIRVLKPKTSASWRVSCLTEAVLQWLGKVQGYECNVEISKAASGGLESIMLPHISMAFRLCSSSFFMLYQWQALTSLLTFCSAWLSGESRKYSSFQICLFSVKLRSMEGSLSDLGLFILLTSIKLMFPWQSIMILYRRKVQVVAKVSDFKYRRPGSKS